MLFVIPAKWMPPTILAQNHLLCRQDLRHRDQLVDICMEAQDMVLVGVCMVDIVACMEVDLEAMVCMAEAMEVTVAMVGMEWA